MGFGSFIRYTLVFLSGLYFGYKCHEVATKYDQELQKVRQTHFPVYNDDNQSDASSSSSDNHSEPEFIDRNLTSLGRESPKETDDLESSESSEDEELSDSDESSNSRYMRSFMSAINQFGPGGQSTALSSRAGSPSEARDGLGSPQTPIVVQDSDDTNAPGSSSIMATIRTIGSNIPLGVIMVSRPDHSYSRSPSPSPSSGPSSGPSRPYSPNTGYNSNGNAKNDKSDNESDGDTDPCERFNCFA